MDGHGSPSETDIANYTSFLTRTRNAELAYQVGSADNVSASVLATSGVPLDDLLPSWTELVMGTTSTAARLTRLPSDGWRELSSSSTGRCLGSPGNSEGTSWLLVSLHQKSVSGNRPLWIIHASETPVRQLPSRATRRQQLEARLLPAGTNASPNDDWRIVIRNQSQHQWINIAADSCRSTLRIREADGTQIVKAELAGYTHVAEGEHPPIPTLAPGEVFTIPHQHVMTTFAPSDLHSAAIVEGCVHDLDLTPSHRLI